MNQDSQLTNLPPLVLGPFLSHPRPDGMGFWLAVGPTFRAERVQVEVLRDDQSVGTTALAPMAEGKKYGVWAGAVVSGLLPDTQYFYRVSIDGKEYTGDLKKDDFVFTTLPAENTKTEVQFAFVSCNGIEQYAKDHPDQNPWAMWERLELTLRERTSCRFLILGGDQVYMDDKFGSYLGKDRSKAPEDLTKRIWEVYSDYWCAPAYRLLMARYPSMLMWDDHDLIDGWGSRTEAYTRDNKLRPRWRDYGEQVKAAFSGLQASRNPGRISAESFSFSFCWDRIALLALDLRTHRDVRGEGKSGRMLSSAQKTAIESEMVKLSDCSDRLFLITPVTIARMGGGVETALGQVSNYVWWIFSILSYERSNWRIGVVMMLALLGLMSTHLDSNVIAGIPQAIFLTFIFGALLAMELFRKKDTSAPKRIHNFAKSFYGATFGVSAITLFFLLKGLGNDRPLCEIIFEKVARALSISWPESTILGAFGVTSIIGASVRFDYRTRKTSNGYKWSTIVMALSLSGFAVMIWWFGLPGKHLQIETILLLCLSAAISIVFFVSALLDAMGLVDEIAGLDDDMKDAWSSEQNSKELHWLSSLLTRYLTLGKKVVVLTGDIHTGGLTHLTFDADSTHSTVPQITSSPIAYTPMPALVEKLTSGNSAVRLPSTDPVCSARNVFFISERNFVLVTCGRENIDAEFFFEGHATPVKVGGLV